MATNMPDTTPDQIAQEITNKKSVPLLLLDKLAQDFKARLDTTNSQVEALAAAGGEPNVITAVKVNGTAVSVTDKAVDIPVPTAVSDLTNDSGYQTSAQVEAAITGKGYQTAAQVTTAVQSAIAKTGHARFEKAASVPSADAAADNVLYLVMNSDTNHYDIYAKVITDPAYGNFAATYGITFAEGETTKEVAFEFGGHTTTMDITATNSMQSIAAELNSDPMSAARGIAVSFDEQSGHLVATKAGATTTFLVKLGEDVLTPKATFASEVVLLDDTTVDLSGYDTAAQTDTKLAGKVDKADGKDLSSNDFTDADKAKLDGIEFATEDDYNAMINRVFGSESEG